ncbi:MAG: TraR/DksA C4-type zinc finger protein, partial [Chloroflexota bacterium]
TRRVYCVRCGERVNDGREVLRDGAALCRACAGGAYYARLGPGAVAPHGPGAAASGAG